VLATPGDAQVAALLGLGQDTGHAEAEAPECLVWVCAGDALPVEVPPTPSRWHGRPNRLSGDHVQWADLEKVQRLTLKPRGGRESADWPRAASAAAIDPPRDVPAARIFRQRRSAVRFDGATHIGADRFFAMLEATMPRGNAPPWDAWAWPPAVHLAIMVHRVEALEPGLYVLVRDPRALEALRAALRPDWLWRPAGPPGLPLYLLLPHDLRNVARQICCHQDIAADSCYALGMLARYELAAAEPWRYRALFQECGMLGQVLYLEAEAAGIRATGIGCYFDDEMHALLGLRGLAWQSLYHFTAGGPVDDARLTTLAPYPASRASRPLA
jgi:hypothetical protein